jgi:hypothetical protein
MAGSASEANDQRAGSMMGMNHDGKSGPMIHAVGGMIAMGSGEMQAMGESMQKKMIVVKTDTERQALMSEQQKLMMEKRVHMMPTNVYDHYVNGMPGNVAERRQMMQRRMGNLYLHDAMCN